MRSNRVVGFGAMNLDLIYRVRNDRILDAGLERGGEGTATPAKFDAVLKQAQKEGELVGRSAGGSAANTCYALDRMGFEVGFIGRVGADPDGDFLLKEFGGVDQSGIVAQGKTGQCISVLDEDGERALLALPNTNNSLAFEESQHQYSEGVDFLHLSSFRGEEPLRAQIELVRHLAADAKVSFDPGQIYASRGLDRLLPLVERTYLLFISDSEAELLTGREWEEACRILLAAGPEIVVCRLGEAGSKVFRGSDSWALGAIPATVADKTGAGDVYAAGFLAGLLLDETLLNCALIGAQAAAHSISGYGRSAYPDKAFLDGLVRRLT